VPLGTQYCSVAFIYVFREQHNAPPERVGAMEIVFYKHIAPPEQTGQSLAQRPPEWRPSDFMYNLKPLKKSIIE
jgi:hypothetical protein